MAEAVHRHGAKLSLQLHHGGFVSPEDMKAGRPLWVPSFPEALKKDISEMWLPEEIAGLARPADQERGLQGPDGRGHPHRRAAVRRRGRAGEARRG